MIGIHSNKSSCWKMAGSEKEVLNGPSVLVYINLQVGDSIFYTKHRCFGHSVHHLLTCFLLEATSFWVRRMSNSPFSGQDLQAIILIPLDQKYNYNKTSTAHTRNKPLILFVLGRNAIVPSHWDTPFLSVVEMMIRIKHSFIIEQTVKDTETTPSN